MGKKRTNKRKTREVRREKERGEKKKKTFQEDNNKKDTELRQPYGRSVFNSLFGYKRFVLYARPAYVQLSLCGGCMGRFARGGRKVCPSSLPLVH